MTRNGSSSLGRRPANLLKWGKCKMRPKYHIRLVCFNDCPDKESHVRKDKVSKEKKDEMVA
jgi:hypothetical protein